MTLLPTLDLNELATGSVPAITPAVGGALAEAASVCLELRGHAQGVELTVRGIHSQSYLVRWQPITAQAFRSWQDERQAAQKGAECVAILLAKSVTGFEVVNTSRQGTRFDYWLGEQYGADFVPQAGLEASGINVGNEGSINSRVQGKLKQVRQSGAQQWQTFVIVVEFSRPLAEVR